MVVFPFCWFFVCFLVCVSSERLSLKGGNPGRRETNPGTSALEIGTSIKKVTAFVSEVRISVKEVMAYLASGLTVEDFFMVLLFRGCSVHNAFAAASQPILPGLGR